MTEKILQYLNSKPDKVMHFGGGYILATAFPIPVIWGLIIAIVAGILKEFYDSNNQDKHTVDKYDAIATWLGGVLGYLVLIIK